MRGNALALAGTWGFSFGGSTFGRRPPIARPIEGGGMMRDPPATKTGRVNVSPFLWFLILQALGLTTQLVEDPDLV